jgi:hypothetical protein
VPTHHLSSSPPPPEEQFRTGALTLPSRPDQHEQYLPGRALPPVLTDTHEQNLRIHALDGPTPQPSGFEELTMRGDALPPIDRSRSRHSASVSSLDEENHPLVQDPELNFRGNVPAAGPLQTVDPERPQFQHQTRPPGSPEVPESRPGTWEYKLRVYTQ